MCMHAQERLGKHVKDPVVEVDYGSLIDCFKSETQRPQMHFTEGLMYFCTGK